MEIVDHLFILLLLVVQPVYGAFEAKRQRARAAAGIQLNRVRFYRDTMIMEWIFLAALLGVWFIFQRPLAALGIVSPAGMGFWLGAGFVVIVAAGLLISWRRMKNMNNAERADTIESIGDVAMYLPRTDRELRHFTYVSATAGVVEEIVYRGFVIWYLGMFMPLWPAVLVSSIFFGLAHSYQGAKGALRCGLLGLGFGVFYVLTGSIWLPIVAHFLLDALQGLGLRELFRDSDEDAKLKAAAI